MFRQALVGVLSVFLLIPPPGVAAEATAGLPDAKPLHQQIVEQLKQQRGVLTRTFPDVHPKRTTYNAEAPVPPQCYTRTEGHYNPCYVCHQNARSERENRMNDGRSPCDADVPGKGRTINGGHNVLSTIEDARAGS